MKTLSIFLFVLSICMICHVNDNRIGPKILEPGQSSNTNFKTNIWGTTRFMCTLHQGPNYRHHQSFTAFKQEGPVDTGSEWDWRARENGIYLKVWDGKSAKSKVDMHKKYDWIN
ncbi:hypothetical protein EUTSA_v10005287mg [Eutrema salsugineum]|uniref:Uncharacterized protein n=1 Tax=Eutrema salsugineum TaxID=72664 RepID=V4KND7_EUTSA|nr:hypothetical protein EUTSA_v10005287mg [Eutrema salsugineum]